MQHPKKQLEKEECMHSMCPKNAFKKYFSKLQKKLDALLKRPLQKKLNQKYVQHGTANLYKKIHPSLSMV